VSHAPPSAGCATCWPRTCDPARPECRRRADRPRYRVLASPRYDHEHSGRYPADACEPAGWELEVYRVDAASPDPREPLGVTQLVGPGRLPPDPRAVRALVVDWLRLRAAPRPCRATPADVELYARLADPP
jgi:hypothetical protein